MSRVARVRLQGSLDCLCGVYTLINVVNRLRGPLPQEDLEALFEALIDEYSSQWGMRGSLLEGTTGYQLSRLIRSVISEQYQLVFKKPFHRRPNVSIDEVWLKAQEWVESEGLIIWAGNDHWTVIERMTDKVAFLLDSSNLKSIRKSSIQNSNSQAPSVLPTCIYFVRRLEGDCE